MQEVRQRAHKKQMFPLVGGTIHTQVTDAFVLVPLTVRIRTGHIKQNITGHAFLEHMRFLPRALTGLALRSILGQHMSVHCRKRQTIHGWRGVPRRLTVCRTRCDPYLHAPCTHGVYRQEELRTATSRRRPETEASPALMREILTTRTRQVIKAS